MNHTKGNTSSLSQTACALLFFAIIILSWTNPSMAQNAIPLTLQDGLKIVTEESRVIKIAKLSEVMAESDTHTARAGLLPSVNASASHTSLAYQPGMVAGGQTVNTSGTQYYAYSLSIQQILFDFWGSLSRYEAARMLLEAQKHDTTRIRNAIAFDFTQAFYEYLESEYLVETASKEIERLEAHLQNATHLHEGGVITRNDLLQAQVRLSDARQKLLSGKNLKAQRAAKLNNLLLRPIHSEIRVVDPKKEIAPPLVAHPDESWSQASTRRPEILIVDKTLDAVDFETTLHKAEFLPKLYVRGSNDYMENPYQSHENNWSLMVGVNINLFEGGKSLANLRKSQSRKKQLLEHRAKLTDEIKLELQHYSLNLEDAYARILVNTDTTGQAQENLRINQKRYEEGVGTATEVLDAVTLLTTAETNHIRSIYDYRKAEAALHYVTGKDLTEIYR